MSTSSLGMPIPFGIINGYRNDGTYSLLANIMPPLCIFKYGKPTTINSTSELKSLDKSKLNPGDGFKNKNENNKQFIYDYKEDNFLEIGNCNIQEYLNIYALYHGEELNSFEFFMRAQINSIQSNIKLLSMLDSNFAIYNNEIITLLGLNGRYDIDNSLTNNIITNLLYINLKNGLYVLIRRVLLDNNINLNDIEDNSNFKDLISSIIESVNTILMNNTSTFLKIVDEGINIDISMFINYIASCYASLSTIFTNYFNSSLKEDNTDILEPLSFLSLIDKPLVNKLKLNSNISSYYEDILHNINNLINNPDITSSYNVYKELKTFISFCLSYKKDIHINKFIIELCEGIGGIVCLALFFSILANGDTLTKTNMYIHFITPKKFESHN